MTVASNEGRWMDIPLNVQSVLG